MKTFSAKPTDVERKWYVIDAEDKTNGQRWKAKEVALYETDGDKIVRETFFMAPMG